MQLQKLYLHQFRNFENATVYFSPKLNVIWGKNAQGKTNLAEAIFLLMIGRSFRTQKPHELFLWGKEDFYLEAQFTKHDVSQSLTYGMSEGGVKKIVYNRTPCRSLTSLLGILPGILMSPDDDVIKGPPQTRRQFLDILLSQSDPLYLHHLSRYYRALKQRNCLLKAVSQRYPSKNIDRTLSSSSRECEKSGLGGIETWEEMMSGAASYLIKKRNIAVAHLREFSQSIYPELSGESGLINVTYETKAPYLENENEIKNFYLRLLCQFRTKDLQLGSSTQGPHRDEMNIFLDEKNMRIFGSEGQKRTLVAALRFASWHLLHKESQTTPLMIIDDLDASLDKNRRERLMEYCQNLGQVFITSTEPPTHTQGIYIDTGKVIF